MARGQKYADSFVPPAPILAVARKRSHNGRIVPGRAKTIVLMGPVTSARKAAPLTDGQREMASRPEYLEWCRLKAQKYAKRCRRRGVFSLDEGDFYQACFEGLSDAIKGYDPEGGVSFESYAYRRMEGACLDEM